MRVIFAVVFACGRNEMSAGSFCEMKAREMASMKPRGIEEIACMCLPRVGGEAMKRCRCEAIV